MKTEIAAIKKALATADELEKQIEPFFNEEGKVMVAPVKQYLENYLARVQREDLNSKLTPEIIKENQAKEEEKIVEAARKRMQDRQARREAAKQESLEQEQEETKAGKKPKPERKTKVIDLSGVKPKSDLGSAQSADTGSASGTDELTEEQKAALAAQGGGSASDSDELTEEQKAALAAQGGGSASDSDELTEEQKAALAAQSTDESDKGELTDEEKELLKAETDAANPLLKKEEKAESEKKSKNKNQGQEPLI
jgi:hypothetical protein